MTMSRSPVTRTVLLAVATVVAAGAHPPALGAAPGTYVAWATPTPPAPAC